MREKGYSTQKREKIKEFLMDNYDRTVTIQDVLYYLKQEQMEVNITTIYRYLEKLESEGLVLKTVHGKREQASFQYVGDNKECHNHLHMKCRVCGLVFHLDCEFMGQIQEHILKEHGFEIRCEESYLTGICAGCRSEGTSGQQKSFHEDGCACGCNDVRIHK